MTKPFALAHSKLLDFFLFISLSLLRPATGATTRKKHTGQPVKRDRAPRASDGALTIKKKSKTFLGEIVRTHCVRSVRTMRSHVRTHYSLSVECKKKKTSEKAIKSHFSHLSDG